MSALILIDLQNDFLAASAPFKVDPKSQGSLRKTLEALIPAFRSSGGHVIWVKSHYAPKNPQEGLQEPDKIPGNNGISSSLEMETSTPSTRDQNLDWVVNGTHTGKKPCCQEGSYGAELVSWSDALRHPNDTIVIKTFFSAFQETTLEETLVEQGVQKLYFGGLLSNVCVLATSLSAVRIALKSARSWETYVVRDALAWRREESHRRALGTMENCGVSLVGSESFGEVPDVL